jgi:hypothetical protein
LKLKISGVDFVANLIVLDSKGIDVIFWNGLVKQAKGTHISAKESMKLTTPDRSEFEYVVEPVVTTKGAGDRVKLNQ